MSGSALARLASRSHPLTVTPFTYSMTRYGASQCSPKAWI